MIGHFITPDESKVDALGEVVDAAKGYPCCPVDCDEKCPCPLHRYSDNSPAPHVRSHTLHHALKEKHPERAEWAYRIDDTVLKIARDGEARAIEAVALVTTKTADWTKVGTVTAAVSVDPKIEADPKIAAEPNTKPVAKPIQPK